MAKNEKATPAAESTDNGGEKKKRTRTAMPFGRSFGVTIKFHNDLTAEKRDDVVNGILTLIGDTADNENFDVHRSTRGEPNPNLQTWLIAPFGYDWPEGDNKERGIRLPAGPLADAVKAYAAKNEISIEEASRRMAEAFGLVTSDASATSDDSASDSAE